MITSPGSGPTMTFDLAAARVREWMEPSPPVITMRTSVATALRLLREHRLPALPVCEDGRFRGLVDERSLLRLTPSEATTLDVYELHAVLGRLTVGRVVDQAAPTVGPDTTLRDAAALMARSGREAAAVVERGRLVGLLPWTTVLGAVSAGGSSGGAGGLSAPFLGPA